MWNFHESLPWIFHGIPINFLGTHVMICDRICENPTLPGFIDFVLEAIIVTKQHFGENAVITATGQQTHGLQDVEV